jgi:hypothetical protein
MNVLFFFITVFVIYMPYVIYSSINAFFNKTKTVHLTIYLIFLLISGLGVVFRYTFISSDFNDAYLCAFIFLSLPLICITSVIGLTVTVLFVSSKIKNMNVSQKFLKQKESADDNKILERKVFSQYREDWRLYRKSKKDLLFYIICTYMIANYFFVSGITYALQAYERGFIVEIFFWLGTAMLTTPWIMRRIIACRLKWILWSKNSRLVALVKWVHKIIISLTFIGPLIYLLYFTYNKNNYMFACLAICVFLLVLIDLIDWISSKRPMLIPWVNKNGLLSYLKKVEMVLGIIVCIVGIYYLYYGNFLIK